MSRSGTRDAGAPAPALRVDPRSGVRQEVEYFSSGSVRLFGSLHLPRRQPHAGVVICSPFQAELLKTYRREVLLARALAVKGFAVQRFHYRGSGNSDGDADDGTFDAMCRDTEAAVERLIERTGVARIAFVGTRLGGLVAAAAVGRRPGDWPLALWEPVVDPSRYFREVFRGLLVTDLKAGAERPSRQPLDELARKGSVDVLGYTITARVHESALGHSLIDELGDRPRPLLLVGSSRGRSLPAEYAPLVSGWTEKRFPVETHVVPTAEAWWFGRTPTGRSEELVRAKAFVELVMAWLVGRLPPDERAQ